MPRKKQPKHHQKLGFKSWLMIGGLMGLVGLMLLLAKLKTPQDIRQKAAGSECFIVVKDSENKMAEVVEGAGGRQQIGGVTYCVGGVGNDADRYPSFYDSKIAGQTGVQSPQPPCSQSTIDGYTVGESCQVEGREGKVICVGGPEEEYIGCIGQINQEQFYQRLTTRKLNQPSELSPTIVPTKSAETQPTKWQDMLITVKAGFEPRPVLDPTREEKNQWPWLALFINNGANLAGAYDQADCSSDQLLKVSQSRFSCGTPNQYLDRLWDNFEVKTDKKQTELVKQWQVRAGDLIQPINKSQTRFATKLSFVFYNGYWNGDKASREVSIKFIEFYGPDGKLIKRYTPEDDSFWSLAGKQWSLKHSFYFDLGKVNDRGEVDEHQDGFVRAFDKQKLRSSDKTSTDQAVWLLDEEGSFNLVTTELFGVTKKLWQTDYGQH